MNEATRAGLFEPSFTTKELGKGMGLGLATVCGIVRQSAATSGSTVNPPRGTVLKVFLPRVEAAKLGSDGQPRGTRSLALQPTPGERRCAQGLLASEMIQ
jgi:hypothetical protein